MSRKNIDYFLAVTLIVSISVNLFAWQKIQNLESSVQKLKEQNQSRGLELIENEYTENLDKVFSIWDEDNIWKTYRNEECGFEIKYPEEFNKECRSKTDCFAESEWKKVEIKDFSFNSDRDFYSGQNENKVSDNVHFTFGSFRTINHLIDFNVFEREEIWDNQKYQVESSLFAIGFHFNESNLSFDEFISQEILSTPEGIENQRVIKINGVEGYRIVLPPAVCSAPLGTVYYLPTQDNKTIISIGAPIEISREGYRPETRLPEFIKIYPQYKKEIEEMENRPDDSLWEFMKNNHDYRKFIDHFSMEYERKELNKRLLFEKIVYSFKFY